MQEARRDLALDQVKQENDKTGRLMGLKDVEVLTHCLLLDDVHMENNLIIAKLYGIFILE